MKTFALLSCLVLVACDSSGGASSDGAAGTGGSGGAGGSGGTCRANTPVGASSSWTEDGVAKCAVTIVAQRATDATSESLQFQAVTLDGASVAFAVIAYGTPLEGTHPCSVAGDGGPLLGTPGTVYVDFVHTGKKDSCSVTITNPGVVGGAHATGSFSATFTGSGGAVVAAGVFDTPVKAPPTK
jgi:hypothetical protein